MKRPSPRARAGRGRPSRAVARRPSRRAKPEIDVTVLSWRWRRSCPRAGSLCRSSARAAVERHAADAANSELSIVLADDAMVRSLNKKYRRKDKPTNVLAFPGDNGGQRGGGPPRTLGDVVLAYETVRAEALASARPLTHHLCHLVVHGVLHLLGHDHREPRAARRMERLEREALASMGIPDPYGAESAVRNGRQRK